MDKVIVYVDDAAQAQQILAPLLATEAAVATHWVLVACAPRMTHRISKWVSHRTRENWRDKWAEKLFAQLLPLLPSGGGSVTTVLAKGPLPELVAQLQAELGAARVVDARRPRHDAATEPAPAPARLSFPGTVPSLLTGLGALLALDLA
ncbi:hypothetical protein [Acidovorax soli]|uniref:Universal stress protein family protein n=1 Tax=Acidovorax soli TaxID=592050 RepID=A0A1H3ZSX0_9BURK|nr:hypothetical protein [Acidovorax soli]SEA26705.1 hypothetical protein SAMN05421875_108107 [Acidovorax soli]